jgi:RNA polymerase sigma-70 factor (ECF subfamily)
MGTATATTPLGARIAPHRSADRTTDEFLEVRQRLLAIAYRTLGSWVEAEDVVQDAWLRWHGYDRALVVNPTAFLVTTTTRLAINAASSARMRREALVGPSQPEPVDPAADPAAGIERESTLELGMRVLLERLGPVERAAYIFRQAFDYPYPQIASMLQISEANARQIVSRAHRKLSSERRRVAEPIDGRRLVMAFTAAARRGEIARLEDLLVRGAVDGRDPAGRGGDLVDAA